MNNKKNNSIYGKYIKRTLDFCLALIAIILLSPFLFILAIIVRIKLGSQIIFCQERPGKNEKIFKLYKFRSMTDEKDENGVLLPDDVRLTVFGKKLRATSLDELPELFNILKGDMAIVGPRPLLVQYLPYYKPDEHHRHDVLPGLTGLAQIEGRNFLNWDERFKLDCEYVANITLKNDFKIIIGTFLKVIRHKDIMETPSELTFNDLDVERKKMKDEIRKIIVATPQIIRNEKYSTQLIEIINQSANVNFINKPIDTYGETRLEKLLSYLEAGKAEIRILLIDNNVIGYVWFFRISERRVHLNEIAVDKKYRGSGFGKLLIDEVYRYASNSDCDEIELFVMEKNETAQKFYKSQLFKTEKRLLVKEIK